MFKRGDFTAYKFASMNLTFKKSFYAAGIGSVDHPFFAVCGSVSGPRIGQTVPKLTSSQGWTFISDPFASIIWVLGLQVCCAPSFLVYVVWAQTPERVFCMLGQALLSAEPPLQPPPPVINWTLSSFWSALPSPQQSQGSSIQESRQDWPRTWG